MVASSTRKPGSTHNFYILCSSKLLRYKPTNVSLSSTITQLAFSSAQNLLLWTDTQGSLSWWKDCLPANTVLTSDPKQALPAKDVVDVFADELNDDVVLDDGLDEAFDEDFNIESHVRYEEPAKRFQDDSVREMGKYLYIYSATKHSKVSFSQYYKGTTGISTRSFAHDQRTKISRYFLCMLHANRCSMRR